MHQRFCLVLFVWAIIFVVGCSSEQSVTRKAKPALHGRVAVTNYPLFCVVSSICSNADGPVREVVYVGPSKGDDPHTWVPSVDQIRDLQKVDLIVCNGPGAVFANWMDKVTLDRSKLCKTTDAVKLTEFVVVKDYQLVHSHGPEGEHSHSWVVPHSWLSPGIARKQATKCMEQLTSVYEASPILDNGFAELQKQFDELESVVEEIRTASPSLVVASSTPEVQYLTRDLGWTDRYLQWKEERSEKQAEAELAAMRERVQKTNENSPSDEMVFLWSGKPIDSLEGFVKTNWARNVTVDLIDVPDETLTADGYFTRMASNLKRLGESLE